MRESEFVRRVHEAGGKAYVVGGWPRDRLRGVPPQDKDYVVSGLDEQTFTSIFPKARLIGNSFPVYRMKVDGLYCDVAFARSEKKTGSGYRGFSVSSDKERTIREDLQRRDTTINSMAISLQTGALIDPWGGRRDLAGRIVRATSLHFTEDPVRALRAARQAAQFGFRIESGTLALMRACRDEIQREPPERLQKELGRALAAQKPSLFFTSLLAAGILDVTYPEIAALIGKTQPQYFHPEGDAFVHTMLVLDRAALLSERPEVRFAALVHDLGKGMTPAEILPHHYGHDVSGTEAIKAWNKRMTLPRLWVLCGIFASSEHMRACTLTRRGKILDLILRISRHPIGIDGFRAVLLADDGYMPNYLHNYDRCLEVINAIKGSDAPPELKGAEIGAWVRDRQIKALWQSGVCV